jgi:hypothetical protein
LEQYLDAKFSPRSMSLEQKMISNLNSILKRLISPCKQSGN